MVYAKPPFGDAEQVLNYLARYTHRVAISNHRLVAFENNRVSFRWRDYAHGGKNKIMTVSAYEFLRRFVLHVLPGGLVRIRHFGLFANRGRSAALGRCRGLLGILAKPSRNFPEPPVSTSIPAETRPAALRNRGAVLGGPIIRHRCIRLDTLRQPAQVLHWTCSGFSAHSPVSRIVFIVFILGALSATTALAAPVATPALSAAIGDVPQARAITAHRRVTRPHRTRAISSTRRRKPLAAIHPGHLSPAYRSPAHRIPAHRAAHLASRPQQRRPPAPARRAPALRPAEPLRRSPVATAQAVSLRRRKPAPLPPPLRGSFQSLERQNEISDAEGLERILDDNDLDDRIARKLLVPLPASAALAVNPALPENRRYCRPWTARFLADFARAHAARFGRPIEVSSAVRTVAFQRQLMRINGNAAAAEGDIVSPHVTGATVDIAKSGMTLQEIGWMRSWLLPLQSAGKIDVEEEFQEACFHITVYKSYVPTPLPAHKRPSRQPQPGLQIASRGR